VSTRAKAVPILLLFWAVFAVGCGGSNTPAPESATAGPRPQVAQELAQLREENEHLESRVRELEGRLSLSRAAVRELREEARMRDAAPEREVVRIGAPSTVAQAVRARDEEEEGWDEPGGEPETFGIQDDGSDAPRPVLRLYGSPATSLTDPVDTSIPLQIPPAPPGVPSSLPVAAMPAPELAFRATANPVPAHNAREERAQRADRAAVTAYQQALRHLRDRHFADALRAFDDFLRAHPRHPYAPSAMYWQGEVHYAMRDYRLALTRFSRVVDEYPGATKVADSLYKMGLCHKRMGRERAARRIFERVRRQYPDSVAARLSVQEDA
jgi:tol-pal system protein YbgF